MAVSVSFTVEPIDFARSLFGGRRARYVTTTFTGAHAAGDVPITAANCKLKTAIESCVLVGITDGATISIGGHYDKELGKLIIIDATGVRATTDTLTGLAMKWLVVGY